MILELINKIKRPGIEDFKKWLDSTDFYKAPASSSHHLNYEGGLVEHSVNVYNALYNIAKKYSPSTPEESVLVAGLFHDVCKINLYVKDVKNQKINGKWEQVPYWRYEDKDPLGHGEKSVIILQRYMKLTEEETYAIRFHMGAWEAEGQGQKSTLNAAINKCKLLKCLVVADQVATYFMEEKKEGI